MSAAVGSAWSAVEPSDSRSVEHARPAKKHRSRIACQACRVARTKCITQSASIHNVACTRCQASGFRCTYPVSHRGRRKGSKNQVTLARIEQRQRQVPANAPEGNTFLSFEAWRGFPNVQVVQPDSRRTSWEQTPHFGRFSTNNSVISVQPPRLPGDTTPLDPTCVNGSSQLAPEDPSQPLTRRILHELVDQFPVGHDRDETSLTGFDGPRETYKHPMVSLASIASRAWDTESPPDGRMESHGIASAFDIPLPPEDAAILRCWTFEALDKAVQQQTSFFEHGLHGSKRDVARGLDAIQRGIVTCERARELCKSFFHHVNPQWAILTESLHTVEFMQARSALLLSTVLAIGSTAQATVDDGNGSLVPEALALHAHVEKLHLVVFATGARSIDIIQAMILFCRFGLTAKSRLAEQRWLRSATIPRMAFEIGLHLDLRHDAQRSPEESPNALRLNDLRTRVFMIVNECRFAAFTGREQLEMSQFELSDSELDELQSDESKGVSGPASYYLYRLQREAQARLKAAEFSTSSAYILTEELDHVDRFIQRWRSQWCDSTEGRLRWHLLHEARSTRLLLIAQIAKRRFHTKHLEDDQERLLRLATQILESALDGPNATHMTQRASIFPFVASLVLKLNAARELVLRVALRMSGDPRLPFISTFVKDAGHALLAMVCASSAPPVLSAGELSDRANAMRPVTSTNDVFDIGQLWSLPGTHSGQQTTALAEGPGFDIGETLAMLGAGYHTDSVSQEFDGSGMPMSLSQYFGDGLQTFLGFDEVLPVSDLTGTTTMTSDVLAPPFPSFPQSDPGGHYQTANNDAISGFSPDTSVTTTSSMGNMVPQGGSRKAALLDTIVALTNLASTMH